MPRITFHGPVQEPPTCNVAPEAVSKNSNLRFVHCPIGHSGGFEARRDMETRDNGQPWMYATKSTIYLDCQIKAECQGIAPITRRTVCHVDTCP